MLAIHSILKRIRETRGLSQRKFSEISNISFRQIQRVEKSQSDVTLAKLQKLLGQFGYEVLISAKEPNWNILESFGFAMHLDSETLINADTLSFLKELKLAMSFLSENRNTAGYERHCDCLKALLLAIQIHYPSLFQKLHGKDWRNISEAFELDKIQGRHIKLRNISLSILSERLSR